MPCHKSQVHIRLVLQRALRFDTELLYHRLADPCPCSASEGLFGITWCSNGLHKSVGRLNLLVDGEDVHRHTARRSAAVQRRERHEQSLRYNVFVRSLPVEGQLKPAASQVLSIFKRTGTMVKPKPPITTTVFPIRTINPQPPNITTAFSFQPVA